VFAPPSYFAFNPEEIRNGTGTKRKRDIEPEAQSDADVQDPVNVQREPTKNYQAYAEDDPDDDSEHQRVDALLDAYMRGPRKKTCIRDFFKMDKEMPSSNGDAAG
jgi:hypothetical protein